ncbi:hypothetical protein PM082_015571 [Marasmius tenuissimus]|nr:hypothetical protein PM082_015571 [Marasmius tenuissimus]
MASTPNKHYELMPTGAQVNEPSLPISKIRDQWRFKGVLRAPGDQPTYRQAPEERPTFLQSSLRMKAAILALVIFFSQAAASIALTSFSSPFLIFREERLSFLAIIGVLVGAMLQIESCGAGWIGGSYPGFASTVLLGRYGSFLLDVLSGVKLLAIWLGVLVCLQILSTVCLVSLIYAINGQFRVQGSEDLVYIVDKLVFSSSTWKALVQRFHGMVSSRPSNVIGV